MNIVYGETFKSVCSIFVVYIIHWVNSVLTYCKTLTKNEEYPKIVCVATHKDQVKVSTMKMPRTLYMLVKLIIFATHKYI